MKKDTIEIPKPIPVEDWKKIEKICQKCHCNEYGISVAGNKTVVSVPNQKTAGVFKALREKGFFDKEDANCQL